MYVPSQMSPTKHLLLTARGSRWREALLAMFTVYIDDSGTDPNQVVAIASGLILPASRLEEFEIRWNQFLKDNWITEFHSSECVATQSGTDFQNWSSQRVKYVCFQVREITKEFCVKAFSFSINKSDYDEFVTGELRDVGGQFHYTWAVRHLISNLDAWAAINSVSTPFEYVFDWMGEKRRNGARREIETVMAQAESLRPGFYEGHYSFRKRKEHPGLQCADLLAWSCYQFSRSPILGVATNLHAWQTFWDYDNFKEKKWMVAVTQKKEDIRDWANLEIADTRSQERRRNWLAAHKG